MKEKKLSKELCEQYLDCTLKAKEEVRRILSSFVGQRFTFESNWGLKVLVMTSSGEIEEYRCESIYLVGTEIHLDFGWFQTNENYILSCEWLDILAEVEDYE